MRDSEHDSSEIFIIKHHRGDHEAYHGGAWKIAFADFMTAMMALFLVLWLISSTSEKTRHAVAQYFNPVKLVDMSTLKKGFRDPKETEMGSGPRENESELEADSGKPTPRPAGKTEPKPAAETTPQIDREAALLREPYAALAEIAAKAPAGTARSFPTPTPASAPEKEGLTDPFATVPHKAEGPHEALWPSAEETTPGPSDPAGGRNSADATDLAAVQAQPQETDKQSGEGSRFRPAPQADERTIEDSLAREAAEESKAGAGKASKLKGSILQALESTRVQSGPHVEVQDTAEGILISLTDGTAFSMFAVGSAEPRPETVHAMEKIGRILKSNPGLIVIRGHTDGRPYRSGIYDNWRLSAARAQMAFYMLLRGGVGENRVEKIEGYADHRLKFPNNPNASENRRIEILLRKDKP